MQRPDRDDRQLRQVEALDQLVLAALEGYPVDDRIVDGGRRTYRLSSPDGRAVEIGHEHAAHLWLVVQERWEVHCVGDLEDLQLALPDYVLATDLYLRAVIDPPTQPEDPSEQGPWRRKPKRRTWEPEECDVAFGEMR